MKRPTHSAISILGIIAFTALASGSASAADHTITFTGEVRGQTCSMTVDGKSQQNANIALRPVSAGQLSKAGSTAGETSFKLGIYGCTPSSKDLQYRVLMLPIETPTKGGNLRNSKNGTAGNTHFQVKDSSGNPIDFKQQGQVEVEVDGPLLTAGSSAANVEYTVSYITEDGGATPGSVESELIYSIIYP
jgi:P pilus assembly protein, pilin FimA